MIESYLALAARIRQELADLEHIVQRAERALEGARHNPPDQDYYIDSVALNLHDCYAGLERIFHAIAATVDGNVPSGRDWHRDLLIQMGRDLPDLRPPVLSTEAINGLDEYLRFRHVVRNVYAFTLDAERIERLVEQLSPAFQRVQAELFDFTEFVEQLGKE